MGGFGQVQAGFGPVLGRFNDYWVGKWKTSPFAPLGKPTLPLTGESTFLAASAARARGGRGDSHGNFDPRATSG